MVFRIVMVFVVNIGLNLVFLFILIGFLLRNGDIFINFGILFFSLVVVFILIILFVELNVSKRVVEVLKVLGVIFFDEEIVVKKVFGAAVMIYVAVVFVVIF